MVNNTHQTRAIYPTKSQQQSDSSESTDMDSEDSDDVPLGQRHPDALKAQATIRAERAKRRHEQQNKTTTTTTTSTTITTAPAAAAAAATDKELARAATIAKLSMRPSGAPDEDDNQPLGMIKRMKTMARPSVKPNSQPSHFPVDQLIKKLEHVQKLSLKPTVLLATIQNPYPPSVTNYHPANPPTRQIPLQSQPQSRNQSDQHHAPLSPSLADHTHTYAVRMPVSLTETIQPKPSLEQDSTHDLSRQMVSAHQQSHSFDTNRTQIIPLDQIKPTPSHSKGHTDYHLHQHLQQQQQQPRKHHHHHHHHHHHPQDDNTTLLQRAKSNADKTSTSHHQPQVSTTPFHNSPPTMPLPPLPSHNNKTTTYESRLPLSSRPGVQLNPIDTKMEHLASQFHSPIEVSPSLSKKILIKVGIVHQSRSMMVEVGQDTTVNDLLRQAQQTGELSDESTKGSWGVFEVWKELGIERPIREIETIMSIVNTWTSADTNETHLLIQKNDLSGLSVSKRSFTSGCHGGNLWCELKPGKWTKKYVLLRDNEIYLCANDKGKDEMFLCTLEKFDVYAIPQWAHRNLKGVPRDYSFGLKSLNKLSFFETKSDFIHRFSCKRLLVQLEWIRRLYDARTYIVMSHRSEEEPTGGALLSRKKSTHTSSRNANVTEKTKGLGLKRNVTSAARQHSKDTTGVEQWKGAQTPSVGATSAGSGATGLSRKPTLVQPSSNTKFKQGTLLGDLVPPPAPSRPSGEDHTTTLQAVLPAHIMALSSPGESRTATMTTGGREPGPTSVAQGRSSSQPSGTTASSPTTTMATTANAATTTTIKLRTWEQMGSDERKLYLAEVQSRAKLEGRTLLQFDNGTPAAPLRNPFKPPSGSNEPLLSGFSAGASGLRRSVTLGGSSSRTGGGGGRTYVPPSSRKK
ncbi:hypothetical protein PCANC_20568 [Puccinia coronata f. sp. avenae]|uniref:PH domain-containing protein n=1 Tax=Puccinia coronata f. sp. avenae TaxID=200324 RepID=A0A2N5SRH0_9BASI|nr:hypothetical protein PCANC_20568 [Puccinia coronata f. sp. avenae]